MEYCITTPCGFELRAVPSRGVVLFRLYRDGKEVSMDALSGELSIFGMLVMANKMQEIAILAEENDNLG